MWSAHNWGNREEPKRVIENWRKQKKIKNKLSCLKTEASPYGDKADIIPPKILCTQPTPPYHSTMTPTKNNNNIQERKKPQKNKQAKKNQPPNKLPLDTIKKYLISLSIIPNFLKVGSKLHDQKHPRSFFFSTKHI